MNYLHWIVLHARSYLAFSTLLVILAASLGARLTIHGIEADRDFSMLKSLDAFAATIEDGTINSQTMGAMIQFGLVNNKAKRVSQGKLPPNAIAQAMAALRGQFIADSIFLLNKQGIILAYSSEGTPSVTGGDMSLWPNVQLAIQGTPNVYPAMGRAKNDRGIYIAAPLHAAIDHKSASIGAVVVKIGAHKLDALLNNMSEGIVVLLSPQGVIFSSNHGDWIFRKTGEISANRIADTQPPGQLETAPDQAPLSPLSFTLNARETSIDGVRYAVRSLPLEWNDPEGDWRLAVLERQAPWWTDWNVLGIIGLASLATASALLWLCLLARHLVLLKDTSAKMLLLATHDELTGLFNRRYLSEQIDLAFEIFERYGNPCSIILLDVDHFKKVNDTYGHPVGDEVLREVSKRLNSVVRGEDIACRFGGEEFLLLLPMTRQDAALHLAERVRLALQEKPCVMSPLVSITASFGVAQLQAGESKVGWLARADQALYIAKEKGRNCVISNC